MKRFINAKNNIVTEAIDGFLATTPTPNLARLDGYPHTKVVIRTDWDKSCVALISGGGSGHEPAHAGFVGKGMLTAAVCGEIFASPSVDGILSAIVAVTGDAGCLLIVKNYTGDRLNFGLAAERAKVLGFKVEMVIVADDIAIPDANHPRGLAGTLFIHKIAGFLASQGASLAEITAASNALSLSCYSIGLSLDSCTVPGNIKDNYLGPEEAELGLGIHGEPGFSRIAFEAADNLMKLACEKLEQASSSSGNSLAVIINNLGAVPPLEMAILANAFMKTELAKKVDIIIGPAPLMTSLDMNGFSISVMELDEERKKALLSEVGVCHWPGVRIKGKQSVVALPKIGLKMNFKPSENGIVRAVILAVCKMLILAKDDLNSLDSRIGDGDTGTTFSNAARSVIAHIDNLPLDEGAELCTALSNILSQNMGGSSGALMAIMFTAAGEAYKEHNEWPAAFFAGVKQMMRYGGAGPGDRTMLDALLPGLGVLLRGKLISEAAQAAREGANSTAGMNKARAGRASYVHAKNLSGVIDPGAEAIARVFETIALII